MTFSSHQQQRLTEVFNHLKGLSITDPAILPAGREFVHLAEQFQTHQQKEQKKASLVLAGKQSRLTPRIAELVSEVTHQAGRSSDVSFKEKVQDKIDEVITYFFAGNAEDFLATSFYDKGQNTSIAVLGIIYSDFDSPKLAQEVSQLLAIAYRDFSQKEPYTAEKNAQKNAAQQKVDAIRVRAKESRLLSLGVCLVEGDLGRMWLTGRKYSETYWDQEVGVYRTNRQLVECMKLFANCWGNFTIPEEPRWSEKKKSFFSLSKPGPDDPDYRVADKKWRLHMQSILDSWKKMSDTRVTASLNEFKAYLAGVSEGASWVASTNRRRYV